MVEQELKELIARVEARRCEGQTLEVKAAHGGCPEKLYDTISSFANQDGGGTFLFGLDERRGFARVGVYDVQDLQKKVMEYCEQMTPVIRPVFTVTEEDGLLFVSAEIPPVDVAERPCFKSARGRLQGSYVRVGDADKPMTEYEVYSYEAFRRRVQEDIRPAEGLSTETLDQTKLEAYLLRRKENRPNLAALSQEQLYEMTGVTRQGALTLGALLLLGLYPQAAFPQLCLLAAAVPGTELGQLGKDGRRFTDSRRVEGTLPEMLDGAMAFLRANMRVSTRIDPKTGERSDRSQYPVDAVREAVLNALVHRDYSIHTEGKPIRMTLFSDRLEIRSPGGLYGRLRVDELGQAQPDARNPLLLTAMEALGKTENRYSGIPRIRLAMREYGLPEPVFLDRRDEFAVILYNEAAEAAAPDSAPPQPRADDPKGLLDFCRVPRSRAEIVEHLALASSQYALRHYLDPLVDAGEIVLSIPEVPKSPRQRYRTAD